MNFSTKAIGDMAAILAAEVGKMIKNGEIEDQEDLENGLREMLKQVGSQAYGQALEQEDAKLGKRVICGCGAKAQRISKRTAKLLTVFGWIEYRRSYYGCRRCGDKHIRLDENWEIQPGAVSAVMGKLLAMAGVDLSFKRACRKIWEFLLVEVSDNTIRKQTQLMGQKQAQREKDWIAQSQEEAWLQERERQIRAVPERVYGSVDGAQVPVGKEWRELKIVSWYHVTGVYGQERLRAQQISYHSEIAPAEEFGQLLWATGVRRLADKTRELIFVCDGATWIWKLVEHYFPQAVQIVDWYHARAYLTPIAEAVFSQPKEKHKWITKVESWLWKGQIHKVIRACQGYCSHLLAGEEAQRAVTYYTNNQHRMEYEEYRHKGYWIGSGTVESACKQIASARLKIAGARWTLPGVIATAKARAAWLSDGDLFSTLSRLPLAA